MPLDRNDFRVWKGGDLDKLRESQERRFKPVEAIDEIVSIDAAWREKRGLLDDLNKEKGLCSKFVKEAFKKHGKKNVR